MNFNAADVLHARPGDTVRERLDRFERYARGTDVVVAGPEHSIDRTRDRTVITLRDNTPWLHPWRVAASAEFATVGPGTVEGLGGAFEPMVPRIGGIDLFGRNRQDESGNVPRIETKEGAGDGLMSHIALRFSGDPEDPTMPDPGDEEPVTIVHTPDLAGDRRAAGCLVGWKVLAVIYWTAKGQVWRVGQVTMHNLAHEFIEKRSGDGGRHYFTGT